MKKTLMLLVLAAAPLLLAMGCSSSGGQGDAVTETAFENQVASTIGFDPALIKLGERAVYFVKRAGDTQTQRYIWSAVAEEGTAIWIETKLPNDPRPFVVKTKIDRSGKVLEEWVGEPGGVPARSRTGGGTPKPVRDSSTAKSDTKEEPDKIVVGGKPYDCTRVTTVLSYPDGRKSTMINWFSKDVPFAASRVLGGLVKRQFGRLTMELVAGDMNAKSELQIPPPEK